MQDEAALRIKTNHERSPGRAQPDGVANREPLQLGDDAPGAAAFGEVTRSHCTLESVVAVPAAPPVAHLDQPRPHIARGTSNGDAMSGPIPVRYEIVTGKSTLDLIAARAPPAQPWAHHAGVGNHGPRER